MFATAYAHHSNRMARLAAARRAQRRWMTAFWLMCMAVLLASALPRTAGATDIRWSVGVQLGGPVWGAPMPPVPVTLSGPVVMVPVGAGPQWGGRGAGQLPPPIVFDAPRLAVVPVRGDPWEHDHARSGGHGWGRRWKEESWHPRHHPRHGGDHDRDAQWRHRH